jgi:hypothetical protein
MAICSTERSIYHIYVLHKDSTLLGRALFTRIYVLIESDAGTLRLNYVCFDRRYREASCERRVKVWH